MELIQSGLSYEIALVYLDDIITFGRTFQEQLESLDVILCRLNKADLKLNRTKCRFF